MNFGNVTCLESDEGLVLIDCGTRDNGRRALVLFYSLYSSFFDLK